MSDQRQGFNGPDRGEQQFGERPTPPPHAPQQRSDQPGSGAQSRPQNASGQQGANQTGPSRSSGYGQPSRPQSSADFGSQPAGQTGYDRQAASQPTTSQPTAPGSQPAPQSSAQRMPHQPGQPSTGQQPPSQHPGAAPAFGQQAPAAAPRRRERRGPGWGALIVTGVLAALIGSGAGAGGAMLTSSGNQQSEVETSTSDQKVKTVGTPDWTSIAAQASKSVVSIQARSMEGEALGSGFVYRDGFIVTNNHVVAPGDSPQSEISVVFNTGAAVGAKIVGRDPSTDIAVLKLDTTPSDLEPLALGNSDSLKVGEPVMALGNPLGLADTVTTGIVSALNRPVATQQKGSGGEPDISTITNAIQIDAAINPGNSGGPLVNAAGKFVGVNSSIATMPSAGGEQGGSIGIGFAIPAGQATYIADQLIEHGKAKHAYLGVSITSGTVEKDGVSTGAAQVSEVEKGSPAAAAGIRKGDAIVKADGTGVNSAVSLQAIVRAKADGDEIPLTVVRGGSTKEITVKLKAR